MIVTTSLRTLPDDVVIARRFEAEIGGTYVLRENKSLAELQAEYNEITLVVIERRQPVVYQGGSRFFFHRGMAELRILNYIRSRHDPMVAAMGLAPGMSVLDCTLGLAGDALVASYAAGTTGKVHGVEVSPVIAALTRWGLTELSSAGADARAETRQAAAGITVFNENHQQFLAGLPNDSYDVVYFDPMFRRPKAASAGIQPLRAFANAGALSCEAIQQALRVTRSRVVIKEAHGSQEFTRLGIRNFGGGRYSPVQYGLLFKEELC